LRSASHLEGMTLKRYSAVSRSAQKKKERKKKRAKKKKEKRIRKRHDIKGSRKRENKRMTSGWEESGDNARKKEIGRKR